MIDARPTQGESTIDSLVYGRVVEDHDALTRVRAQILQGLGIPITHDASTRGRGGMTVLGHPELKVTCPTASLTLAVDAGRVAS